jgi:hypothetical protein
MCLQVLADEPALQLVSAHYLADDQIVRAVVAALRGFTSERAGFLQYDFMRIEQRPQLTRYTLAPARCARNAWLSSSSRSALGQHSCAGSAA